jgi:hypothetical protein
VDADQPGDARRLGEPAGVVPADEINKDTYYANEYGAVTQIAPAKSTGTPTTPASTIYAGTDTGLLWKTTNATAANPSDVQWTRLGAGVLPQRWVTSIAVDPTNADHVYLSLLQLQGGRPRGQRVGDHRRRHHVAQHQLRSTQRAGVARHV